MMIICRQGPPRLAARLRMSLAWALIMLSEECINSHFGCYGSMLAMPWPAVTWKEWSELLVFIDYYIPFLFWLLSEFD